MAQVYAQPVARKTMIVHPVAPPVITQRVARQRIAQPVARGEALQPVARYLQHHAPLDADDAARSRVLGIQIPVQISLLPEPGQCEGWPSLTRSPSRGVQVPKIVRPPRPIPAHINRESPIIRKSMLPWIS